MSRLDMLCFGLEKISKIQLRNLLSAKLGMSFSYIVIGVQSRILDTIEAFHNQSPCCPRFSEAQDDASL
jgi:hypothetical protein